MSSTYYADTRRELPKTGIQPDEIAIYLGTVRDGLRDGPSLVENKQSAYVYRWTGDEAEEIDAEFVEDGIGASVLDFTAGTDRYTFIRNGAKNYLKQFDGPIKPIVIGNIGADPVRIATCLATFTLPAGTAFRLDLDAPVKWEPKKVLLTFSGRDSEFPLESALLLEGARWRPLNICAKGSSFQIKDGPFVVQTLRYTRYSNTVELENPARLPLASDYLVYFRAVDSELCVCFTGCGMRDEGFCRKDHSFSPRRNVIYDFVELCKAPTASLMARCTAQLPGLECLDSLPEQDVPWPEPPEGGSGQSAPGELLADWPWALPQDEV